MTQEQFNELVFFALQVHRAELQSRDWVLQRGTESDINHHYKTRVTDTRDTLVAIGRALFCARFHRIESTTLTHHLHQRFERHSYYAKQLFNNIKQMAGDAWNNNTWPSLLDCFRAITTSGSDLETGRDQIPISMLPTFFNSPAPYRKLSEKEYLEAYKQYKQTIIKNLNAHFNCHFDYTYLGNDKPWIIRHFLEIYIPEILTTIAITSALHYFDPMSVFARAIPANLPSWIIGADISHLVAFKMLEQPPFSTGEPEYLFNPHRHVKIWLSKNKEQFMNQENQLRLVKMRADNHNDQISLVYSAILLSKKAQQDLELFCKKHRIQPICIEEDVIPKCTNNDNEQRLIQLYQDEIHSLNNGGNLGTASDILRWLSPIYLLGMYSDMDVSINTKNIPPLTVVSSPLLLSIGSLKSTSSLETLTYNNDRMSIVDPIVAAKQIETIQNTIIHNCESEQSFHSTLDRMQEIRQKVTKEELFAADELYVIILNYIKIHYQIEDMPYLRQIIQNLTATKESFIELIMLSAPELNTPDNEIQQVLALELNEPIALKAMQECLLKYCVICTTGPAILQSLFDKSVMTTQEIKEHVSHYTYENNQLSSLFSSGNAIPLHSSQEKEDFHGELGVSNDASWLPTGEEQVKQREENLHQKAQVIQKQFKKMMKNIEAENNDRSSPTDFPY